MKFFSQIFFKKKAMDQDTCIGVIICKLDRHRDALRGYIAMLAVKKEYRKRKIGLYFNINYFNYFNS
jgi:hypothetical protein